MYIWPTICTFICNTCDLCIPLPEDEYSLVTDASGLGIGGVLQVRRNGQWEAVAFFSRQLKGAEQRYFATEMEALAMVATIEHFSYYLYGHQFVIYTDHKPLTHILDSDKLNPRLRRLGYKLQHWWVTIEYLLGQENGFADPLTREERPRPDLGKDENKSQESDECRVPPGHSSRAGGCGGTTSTEDKDRTSHPI